MQITIDLIESFDPCEDGFDNFKSKYPDFNGDELDLLKLEDIPINDIQWLLLRREFIPENDLHELACKFAESVLHIFESKYPDDDRPRKAIEAKRKYIKGNITRVELLTAEGAAWAAAGAAAKDAARCAWNTARYAAGDAARCAWYAARAADLAAARCARCAAGDAALAAARCARCAARAAEKNKQREIMIEYFKGKA